MLEGEGRHEGRGEEADDAGGDGVAEPARVAEREHPLADLDVSHAERRDGRWRLRQTQHGEVGLRVAADHLGRDFLAVLEDGADRTRVAHHVVVRDDVAVLINEEAGALGLRPLRTAIEIVVRIGVAETEIEKLFELVRDAHALNLALHENAYHRRADPLDQVGKGKRPVSSNRGGHQARRLRMGGGETEPCDR